MKSAAARQAIESSARAEIDRLIANDTRHRIVDAEAFTWLWLNGLRIALGRLDAKDLAQLASQSGAEIMRRFPGPTP